MWRPGDERMPADRRIHVVKTITKPRPVDAAYGCACLQSHDALDLPFSRC